MMEPREDRDIRQLVGQSGIPPQLQDPQKVASKTLFGPTRTFRAFDRYEWGFLFVSMLNIFTTVGFTIYSLCVVIKASPDFTLTLLILLNAGFCLFYVVQGLLMERRYELLAYMMAISVIILYCAIEYGVNYSTNSKKQIKMIRLILASVLAPINIALGIKVLLGFKWFEFRVIGPVELLQSIYRRAIAFYCILKFDLQVSWSLVILVLITGSDVSLSEKIVLGIGVPFCFIWVILGWVAVRWERKPLVYITAVLGLASPGYVIYKLYKVYEFFEGDNTRNFEEDNSQEKTIAYIAIVTCAILLIVHIILYCELVACTRNFGLGLKEKVVREDSGKPAETPPPCAGDL